MLILIRGLVSSLRLRTATALAACVEGAPVFGEVVFAAASAGAVCGSSAYRCAAPAVMRQAPTPIAKPAEIIQRKRVAELLAARKSVKEAAMKKLIEKTFSEGAPARMPVEPRLRRLQGFAQEAAPLEMKKALDPM